ncbi:unnamed protein product [Callosobruchus maculatus]|uniref:Uncharacterized protein n=1 Tax=Callosobruchus maculatus TaxID=64391 RepID=A0A653DPC3_CALMS|nr:unnamed protein product [Callosobruchus maculatus]
MVTDSKKNSMQSLFVTRFFHTSGRFQPGVPWTTSYRRTVGFEETARAIGNSKGSLQHWVSYQQMLNGGHRRPLPNRKGTFSTKLSLASFQLTIKLDPRRLPEDLLSKETSSTRHSLASYLQTTGRPHLVGWHLQLPLRGMCSIKAS